MIALGHRKPRHANPTTTMTLRNASLLPASDEALLWDRQLGHIEHKSISRAVESTEGIPSAMAHVKGLILWPPCVMSK